MTISVHTGNKGFIKHIQYVLNFLNDHSYNQYHHVFKTNASTADVDLFYGKAESIPDFVRIPRQKLIFSSRKITSETLFANCYNTSAKNVYSVESERKGLQAFFQYYAFTFDWIETIFFHISRYEEYHCSTEKKDQWEMMKEQEQFLVRNKLYHQPVVDHLVAAIFESLGLEYHRSPTSYSITHDIDVLSKYASPYRFVRSLYRELLDKRNLKALIKSILRYSRVLWGKEKDPYDSFDFLFVRGEYKNIMHKILFMMAGGETSHDNFYQLEDEKAKNVMALAFVNGYEIGLHPSYNADKKKELFRVEKKTLEKAINTRVKYSRQHFLHFSFLHTPEIIEKEELSIDSTLGYQRLIGFRCGTGFPYKLFHFKEKRGYHFKELPMIIMDVAILMEVNNDLDKANKLLSQFLDQNQLGTHITINFHNTLFDPTKRNPKEMKKLYLHLLDRITSQY